jgi:hypothetical protein
MTENLFGSGRRAPQSGVNLAMLELHEPLHLERVLEAPWDKQMSIQ